jgi:hypothetical protein
MRRVAVSLVLLGLVACSAPGQDGRSRPSSLPTAPAALGAIQTRDFKVTWLAGQKLRVENARGAVVADGVTADDLERLDLFLYTVCTQATASGYDASLSRSSPAPMAMGPQGD